MVTKRHSHVAHRNVIGNRPLIGRLSRFGTPRVGGIVRRAHNNSFVPNRVVINLRGVGDGFGIGKTGRRLLTTFNLTTNRLYRMSIGRSRRSRSNGGFTVICDLANRIVSIARSTDGVNRLPSRRLRVTIDTCGGARDNGIVCSVSHGTRVLGLNGNSLVTRRHHGMNVPWPRVIPYMSASLTRLRFSLRVIR